MSTKLNPALQESWETKFYKDYGIKLKHIAFSCKEEVVIYDLLETVLDSCCLSFEFALRFEIRLKDGGNPWRTFSQILTFFEDLYGVSIATIKGSETKLVEYEGYGCFLVKKFEFSLREEFILDIKEYIR